MRRAISVLLGVVLALELGAQQALAQSATWPNVNYQRGPGFYLNWVKIALCWLVFLIWVSSSDWVNIDAQRNRFKYMRWNSIVVFPFVAAFLLVWLIPFFWLASFPLLLIAYLVPLTLYVRSRNAQLEPHLRVLTPDHLRFLVAERLNTLGFKISTERRTLDDIGPPIKLFAEGGATERDNGVNLITARQSPGFLLTRELLADALDNRADSVMLDFTPQEASVRYQVDGVWHPSMTRDREGGDAVLAVLKTLCAAKAEERRARQQGHLRAEVGKRKYKCRFVSQGTKTGERAILEFDDGATRFKTIADLGMREKMQEALKQLMAMPEGYILVAAPPGSGLTTCFNAVINSTDRFVRSFVAIEEASANEREIENVPVTTYRASEGESPASVLPALARLYPEVIVCRRMTDLESVVALCDQIAEKRQIYSSIQAKDCSEALLRVLLLKVPAAKFAPVVTAVLTQRLVRKLCEACKEAYPPPPQVLKQMGIPQGKIEAFYRPPQEPQKVCPECKGIGYIGRTGFFELLIVNDAVREALMRTPKLDIVRQEARKAGMRSLQEEGLLLVARGVTSLAELSRVLKE